MRNTTGSSRPHGGVGTRRPLLALAGILALVAAGCGSSNRAAAPTATPVKAAPARATTARAGESIVATALAGSVGVYRSPGARTPFLRLANPIPSGEPLVFLVRARRAGWEQVYLPVRPDGATGWVNDRDVSLAYNPYSLEVSLRRHELVLRKRAQVLARIPAAVGRSVLPTPTGRYFIVELLKQPDPTGPYGPYAFGLSAFSKVLYSFGGGPGQIGIHGTNEPASIGRNQSHGCIRISNGAIARLAAELPLGTPVSIGN